MDRIVVKQLFRPRPKLIRIAFVMPEPLLEHFVDRAPLPGGGMVRIDRIDPAKAEDRLRVERKRVGLQAIDGSDRYPLGALGSGWSRRWASGRARRPRIVERSRQSLERNIARQAAADRVQPQQEARRHGG